MKTILNPKWLLFINTLPIIVLFIVFFEQYTIIQSLLNNYNKYLWKLFGFILAILGALNFLYVVFLIVRKREVSVYYSFVSLILYISYIYLYDYYLRDIIPLYIPRWMIFDDILISVGAFLMPTLLYSLFILVIHYTPETPKHHPVLNFVYAISIPLFAFIFFQVILPLWKVFDNRFNIHVFLIFAIIGTLFFLFFFIRGIFILILSKSHWWKKHQWVWKIPICVIFPIAGLLTNNLYLIKVLVGIKKFHFGIFGDFNNLWFYVIAIINGIVLCLPSPSNKTYRILLFVLRSITFSYTVYFLLVFLPFLPFSIIAILALGMGFLMLTPLMIFIIHVNELFKDFYFLKSFFSKKYLFIILLLSFFVIPTGITIRFLEDKKIISETLEYIYMPDYSKNYDINTKYLKNTLEVIEEHKGNNVTGFFGTQIPYITSYFNWLVLDNLTLSQKKINYIKKIFFAQKDSIQSPNENIPNKNIRITNITKQSNYDTTQNIWKSWINLEITNFNDSFGIPEYTTEFNLPEGCWISNYYLTINNKKQYGVLAEKKSAMWVYSKTKMTRQDPGILYYLSNNTVALNIFPITKNEIRKTGIEILHKEPVKITIDSNIIELGNSNLTNNTKAIIETKNAIYVSAQQKKLLRKIQRKPYFHFMVDVSENQKIQYLDTLLNQIKSIIYKYKAITADAKISLVNSYVKTYSLSDNWQKKIQQLSYEGGFYLDRAIRLALLDAYKKTSYPIIIVVSNNMSNAILEKDFSDIQFAAPEVNYFFHLSKSGNLIPHSLINDPQKERTETVQIPFSSYVLEYKVSSNNIEYLSDNDCLSIVLKKDTFNISPDEISEKNWLSGLTMQAMWRSQILHPEISNTIWKNLIKYSFISKIMNPVTSYLVLENEAQKKAMEKKQKQIIAGNSVLDPDEDIQQMTEPEWWFWCALLCIIAVLYLKKYIRD